MTRLFCLTVLTLLFIAGGTSAQTADSLRKKLEKIIAARDAVVGIAISGNDGLDTLSINGNRHFPMQSVFKFHVALALLSEVDQGKFSLNQKVKIGKEELSPDIYSPIKEEYPDGTSLAIAEIIQFTISQSDGIGCDILLKLIGGPSAVEAYFLKNNFKDVSIKINEEVMQGNWDKQYLNWTTPKAANHALSGFYQNKPGLLSKTTYDFIWKVMRETTTGKERIKGQLPVGTVVAHKTGSSGTNPDGLTAAVNDIGIVFLPNGKHFFISVFVSNSTENPAVSEKIIADIAKATWDYFQSKTN